MAAETRLATVLFGSFLVWLPALGAFLGGDLDAGAVGVRYAGAVAVVSAGMVLITTILAGYRADATAEVGSGHQASNRRSDDPSVAPMQGPGAPAE